MKDQIIITPVSSPSDLKKGTLFRIKLYDENPYAVPPLIVDELNTLNPKKNAAFEFCDAQTFHAHRNGEMVGRITGIIQRRANETWNQKNVRFTFFDFIDDLEVSKALLGAVGDWGRKHGMTDIEGPMGFTDMDQEGMLIEGFDQLGTMVTFYNYPYYPAHIQQLGYEKSADWVEFRVKVVSEMPEKFVRIANIVEQKFKLRTLQFNSMREILKQGYARKLFELVNKSYSGLHGFTQLSERQIDSYVKLYVPLLSPKMISLVVDEEGELIGMGVAMPSLSKALQKAKGRMFPFGFFHLLKALKMKNDLLDLLIVAISPEYQGKGVNSLVFMDLQKKFHSLGFEYAESNPELEVNEKMKAQWEYFPHRQHKRRRAFKKRL